MNDATPPRRDLAEVLLTLGACNDTPADAVPWARPYGSDWERALAECRQRDWLFWLAGRLRQLGHLRAEALVTTACACARHVLHFVPADEERPRIAVETAERWASGHATGKEVHAAREGADFAACALRGPASTVRYGFEDAARAAADAARTADDSARAAADSARADADSARAAAAIRNAADAARAAAAHAAWATNGRGSEVTDLVRRELGPALLAGLAAYAGKMPAQGIRQSPPRTEAV